MTVGKLFVINKVFISCAHFRIFVSYIGNVNVTFTVLHDFYHTYYFDRVYLKNFDDPNFVFTNCHIYLISFHTRNRMERENLGMSMFNRKNVDRRKRNGHRFGVGHYWSGELCGEVTILGYLLVNNTIS